MTDHITLPRSVVERETMPFEHWAKDLGYDTAHTYDTDRSRWVWLSPMTADLWASWLARAALAGAAQAEPVATYMGHRLTPDGTKEFWGLANTPLAKGTKLYTAPQPAQPVAVPQGWKLVPVEPTPAMVRAYRAKHVGGGFNEEAYRAMLKAAPTPPAATVPVLEPLTDDEIHNWWGSENGIEDCDLCKLNDFRTVVRAVEAAHNTKLAKRGGV